jgi:hypothetical protein
MAFKRLIVSLDAGSGGAWRNDGGARPTSQVRLRCHKFTLNWNVPFRPGGGAAAPRQHRRLPAPTPAQPLRNVHQVRIAQGLFSVPLPARQVLRAASMIAPVPIHNAVIGSGCLTIAHEPRRVALRPDVPADGCPKRFKRVADVMLDAVFRGVKYVDGVPAKAKGAARLISTRFDGTSLQIGATRASSKYFYVPHHPLFDSRPPLRQMQGI